MTKKGRKIPQHTFTFRQQDWETARRIAEIRHEKITYVIQRALYDYIEQHRHLLERRSEDTDA